MDDMYDGMGNLGESLSIEESELLRLYTLVNKARESVKYALASAKRVSFFPVKHTTVIEQASDNLNKVGESMRNAVRYLNSKQTAGAKQWKVLQRTKMPSLGEEILTEEEFIEGKGIM